MSLSLPRNRLLPLLILAAIAGGMQTGSAQSTSPKKVPAPRPKAIQVQSPVSGQTVSGTVQLALSGDLSQVGSVRYRLGDYLIGVSTQSPYTVSWNSAFSADGTSQIESIAYDIFGNVLSDIFTPVVFSNFGNKANVVNGLPSTMSGSVTYMLHAYDSVHYPAFWTTAIDGNALTAQYTDHAAVQDNTLGQTLDTTAYPNGNREFYFTFHSNDYNNPSPPPGNENFRGMVMQYVNFQNGRTFMEVIAKYLHVYQPVGGTLALGCSRGYTNGDRDACLAPTWVPTDPTVVSIDASGNMTALKQGYTDITLTEGGKTTLIHVWVQNDPGLPHFTTNGGMSTTYIPGKSTFILAPFLLDPGHASADPNLAAEARRAGINTLTTGMYLNPYDLTTTFASWHSSFNSTIMPGMQWAAANNFRVIGTGDNIDRNIGTEAYRTLNWPFGKQAVQYAVQQFAQSGAAVSIEMIDEAAFLWGPNPTPPGLLGAANSWQSIFCFEFICTATWPNLADNSYHDVISNGLTFTVTGNPAINTPSGTTYTVQNATANTFTFTVPTVVSGNFTMQSNPTTEFEWFARATTCGTPCVPPMLDNSLSTIASWIKSASPTVPISFPPGGIVLPPGQRNWIGQGSLSDYASQYWDDTTQARYTYIFGKGIKESGFSMSNAYYSRQPYMQLNRPQLMLISISDYSYIKNSPSGTDGYNPPLDTYQTGGVISKTVSSTMIAAAALGASGERLYQFETPETHQAAVGSGPGSSFSLSAAPTYSAINLWRSMGYAGALMTNVLQPYLLAPPGNSPAYSNNIITGVRKATIGNMLMIVNAWDGPRTINVDFTPYKFGFGATRYRVNDTYIKNALLNDSAGETITLDSGEAAIYIFPNTNAASGLDNVTFLPVSPVGSKLAVSYGYLYDQNVTAFGETFDCTTGCTIPVDRRIGDVFFQYATIDSAAGLRRSAIQTLGKENAVRLSALKAPVKDRAHPAVPQRLAVQASRQTAVKP